MSYYFTDNRFSYKEYLMAHDFVEDIKSTTQNTGNRVCMEISHQTREILASNQTLSQENIKVVERQGEKVEKCLAEGFERISYDVNLGFAQISEKIDELDATFHWGFSQVLSATNRMNDSLQELIKIAKTPAQTAAYEQYEIARDAYSFRQGLYVECLEYLERAINGDQASTGYKIEWRFHQMMGTILLGFVESDLELMDLPKAEESFMLAARYSKADYPDNASKAWLSASWAAYCQGKFKESIEHTQQALSINPNLTEAFYLAAKSKIALDDVESAFQYLKKAIERDVFYALKAAGDGDFQRYDNALRDFLKSFKQEIYQKLEKCAKDKIDKITSWREHSNSKESLLAQEKIELFKKNGGNWPIIDLKETLDIVEPLNFVRVQMPSETIVREEIVKPASLFRKAITRQKEETIPGKTYWVKRVEPSVNRENIPKVGSFYNGIVNRIVDIGAFIEIFPGVEGLVHISQFRDSIDALNVDDEVLVKCMEISKDGKIRLSIKAASDSTLYGGRVIQVEQL